MPPLPTSPISRFPSLARRARCAAAVGLLLLGIVPSASAQTATVRGFVTDEADGQELIGVNVALEDGSGRLVGAATDTDGFYIITGVDLGRYILRASFVGYATHVDTLTLEAGIRRVNIELGADENLLGEVRVESERTTGAANVTAGLQKIRPEDIELVPTPDVSGDLASYLTTLPGVVTTGDQGGQVYIRGGEPSQNLVLLDGMPVYQPFHVLGFYSAFPTDIVSNADVYAGGYTARYGGQLSSVLDVTARNGNKRRFGASASVAPFVSSVLVEGPLVPDRVSFLANARVSVIEQGAARLVERDLPYTFGDFFGKLHATPTSGSQLSISALHTYDRGIVGDPDSPDPEEVRWENGAVGLRYLLLPVNVQVLGEVLLSLSRLNTELGPSVAPQRSSDINRFRGEFNLTYYLGFADTHFGGFIEQLHVDSDLGGFYQNVESESASVIEAGFYVEPEMRPAKGLTVEPGLRVTTSPNKNLVFVEPRFRAVWEVGPHQLSAATGLYHQTLVGLSDRRDATSIFTAWTTTPDGEAPEAFHAIVGYRITPAPWLDLAVEGFYKKLDALSIGEFTATPRLTTRLQQAEGEVKGMDARVEVRQGPFYGFVNYGLSSVEYTVVDPIYEVQFGDPLLRFRPPHDRRHQVNALASVSLFGFDLSARWQFGSGLPFSRALGFDVFINIDEGIDPFTEGGRPRVIYERPFDSELPTYHRLDVSVERTFDLGPAALTAQAGVINAYDRRNLFAYDTFTLRRSDQLPFVPSFGLKIVY